MLSLVLLLGVAALVAQVAGVGTTERSRTIKPRARTIATLPGSSIPDIGSSKLASGTVSAEAGETVRMRATAQLRATRLARGEVAQVVCGIRYSREDDASWTLGYPTETVVLDHRGARDKVVVERTFIAPARDRYRASTTCHVAAPESGAKVTAIGSLRLARGLPAGAAVPVE
jgi:hypothetical protein